MTTKLKSADIVIVGLGWTGGILAKELADTDLSIVVLERGAPRDTNPDFMYPTVHDELRYAQRHELMQNVSRETLTFRILEARPPSRCASLARSCRVKASVVPACTGTARPGAGCRGTTSRSSSPSPVTAGPPFRPI